MFSTGYTTFFANAADYELNGAPRSWAVIPATRHAMTVHPHSTYFLSLSPHALIMNPTLPLTSHIMAPKRIESLMLKDKPVVAPDSVIKTFSHLRGHNIDLVLTQDGEGLCQGSFVIRQGEWARFFLDSWFDPLYRTYNFQKAEGHALVCSSCALIYLELAHTKADAGTRSTLFNGILLYLRDWQSSRRPS